MTMSLLNKLSNFLGNVGKSSDPINAQTRASLLAAALIGVAFLVVQIELSRNAPAFQGHSRYSFLVLSLIDLVSGCGGWACGLFLSPIGSQMGGSQKVLAGLTVFWSGVVVGNLNKLSGFFSAWQKAPMTSATKIELLFGLGVFLLALCATFNTRFDRVKDSISVAGGIPATTAQSK
jgi:hypothetical protein